MKWTEIEWEQTTIVAGRAAIKRERFAELYGRGTRGVIESAADLTMREVIDLKERFEAGEMTPAEAAEITHRLSVAEPVSQSLPTFSVPRGGITFFRGEMTDALD